LNTLEIELDERILMNLSFTGLLWQASLRAVHENRRSEVIDTLTDCYGTKAPLGEAFRTFTSGSRMRNRSEASSPLDLWRIAIRSALIFSLAWHAGLTLARWALPFEYKERAQPLWRLVLAILTLLIATGLRKNRFSRIAAGLFAFTSAATLLLRDSASFGPKQFPNLFPFQVISAAAMVVGSCVVVLLHRKPKWICALGASSLAGSQIAAYTSSSELFSERWEMYSLAFDAAYVVTFVALIVLSTRSVTLPFGPRSWAPIIMGMGFAILGSVIDSTLLPKHFSQLLSRGLGAGLAILLAIAVVLVAVRPRLFLSSLFFLFLNVLPVMPWRFSGVVAPSILAGICIAALLVGRSASTRALCV
jgi:hypothetical protein